VLPRARKWAQLCLAGTRAATLIGQARQRAKAAGPATPAVRNSGRFVARLMEIRDYFIAKTIQRSICRHLSIYQPPNLC
jgi:hypothetical protein